MADKKYYSGNKVCSYGCPWIFSLGNRSIGKTFDWTRKCINRFLKSNGRNKFLVVRRYDEDLKKSVPTFFDAVRFKYPDHSFDIHGNGKSGTRLYIDGEFAGMSMSLKAAKKYKSVPLIDFTTILHDEFLSEDSVYLPDEVGSALGLYMSVARGNGEVIRTDVQYVHLANTVSMNNPYFRELHIREHLVPGKEYTVDPDRAWVVEITNNKEIAQEINNTPFGKMLAKTKYGDYAMKSAFYLDDNTFIQKPSGNSEYLCTMIWKDEKFGVYDYTDEGLLYITTKVDPTCKQIFSLTTADHKPNYMLLYRNKYNPVYEIVRFAYDNALLRFETMECKFMFLDFMEFTV